MLKVTIELIPFGIGEPKEIASGYIVNDGTGDSTLANYKFGILKTDSEADTEELVHAGELKDYRRKEMSVWYLLHRILDVVYRDGSQILKQDKAQDKAQGEK